MEAKRVAIGVLRFVVAPIVVAVFLFSVYRWRESQSVPVQRRAPIEVSHMTSKLGLGLHVDVRSLAPAGAVPQVGGVVHLEARVRTDVRWQGLRFEWVLPAGVQEVADLCATGACALTGEAGVMDAGAERRFKLGLKLVSKSDQPVRFRLLTPQGAPFEALYYVFSQSRREQERRNLYESSEKYKLKD